MQDKPSLPNARRYVYEIIQQKAHFLPQFFCYRANSDGFDGNDNESG